MDIHNYQDLFDNVYKQRRIALSPLFYICLEAYLPEYLIYVLRFFDGRGTPDSHPPLLYSFYLAVSISSRLFKRYSNGHPYIQAPTIVISQHYLLNELSRLIDKYNLNSANSLIVQTGHNGIAKEQSSQSLCIDSSLPVNLKHLDINLLLKLLRSDYLKVINTILCDFLREQPSWRQKIHSQFFYLYIASRFINLSASGLLNNLVKLKSDMLITPDPGNPIFRALLVAKTISSKKFICKVFQIGSLHQQSVPVEYFFPSIVYKNIDLYARSSSPLLVRNLKFRSIHQISSHYEVSSSVFTRQAHPSILFLGTNLSNSTPRMCLRYFKRYVAILMKLRHFNGIEREQIVIKPHPLTSPLDICLLSLISKCLHIQFVDRNVPLAELHNQFSPIKLMISCSSTAAHQYEYHHHFDYVLF